MGAMIPPIRIPLRIAQSEALRPWLRCGFAVTDSQSFALRNPGGIRQSNRKAA